VKYLFAEKRTKIWTVFCRRPIISTGTHNSRSIICHVSH